MKRHYRVCATRRKQAGFTVLEALLVTLLFAAVMGLWNWYQADYVATITSRQAAFHQKQVGNAAAAYVKNNYAALLASTAGGPVTVSLDTIRNAGNLPAAVPLLNPYGQAYTLAVRRATQGGQAILEALLVSGGGADVPETDLRRTAAMLEGGGFVLTRQPAIAQGSMGSWQVPVASFGLSLPGGNLATALFFNSAGQVTDYLYRNAVAGRPEVNRMNTSIDVNGNDLNNVRTVRTQTVEASGNVSTKGALIVQSSDGASSTGWYTAGNDGWLRVLHDNHVVTNGEIRGGAVRSMGQTFSHGRLNAYEYLYVGGVASEGWACEANGLVARTGIGEPLACQSGVWRKSGGGQLRCEYYFAGRASDNLPADNSWCPAGMIVTSVTSSGSNQNFYTVMGKSLYAGNVGQGYTCCGIS
ncbi:MULTISPECIES: shufflon system plasmid conjugative transfer pilus tip adhesin PilV [Achromobacter]|uniref:Shufflon system plasmid conjugative transfer pilus tip adhesin PilV n=1 Tax=Achromobacter spanius TaxID=217203 RepID=A0A2K8S0S9_9BURK|nr:MULTISPECIES: shufflon system plasmid conjugative transfer pilus tip adhesin PilV [Achromobacter]SPT41701.1 Bacterial shufflon protein, N-terminal constant region [Achromobacter denitrificans]AUA56043.1 shufflon system plasmid conjugative transfer pilus tip adhesin PilV [Achromobacter spanius]MDH0735472.1 shufflon system plasmid conjugative transfer pilus tip adhesin PilV [Achromobacter spanius]PPA77585.1 shufflon system plasmid conjugative transfer pilus tip adhesin PilV [Achromobacter span